jgi:hypothetical protein
LFIAYLLVALRGGRVRLLGKKKFFGYLYVQGNMKVEDFEGSKEGLRR